MKKIFMTVSLVAGLTLVTSCSVKLSECEKNSDYNNTIYRGRNTHNFIVLNNKLDKIIKQNEEIKKQNKDKMYRVSPSKDGKYYVVESSYDGGKTWHFTDSSPTQEEANKKMENIKKGLTASGLTQEEAKASIPEGTPAVGDSDQNSKTKSTKKQNEEILKILNKQ